MLGIALLDVQVKKHAKYCCSSACICSVRLWNSFLHSIYQQHLVCKCMSYHRLPERAWMPCTNWDILRSCSNRDDPVSILKTNLEFSGGLAVLAASKWSTGKRRPSWHLRGVTSLADTHLDLQEGKLASHFGQAKYTKLIIITFFLQRIVSLMSRHHFASKRKLSPQPFWLDNRVADLGCQRAVGAWNP